MSNKPLSKQEQLFLMLMQADHNLLLLKEYVAEGLMPSSTIKVQEEYIKWLKAL